MKSMKNRLRSQQSDTNVKNGLLLSVTNLTPNITDLKKAKQYQVSLNLVMFISPVCEIILFVTANGVHPRRGYGTLPW